MICTFLRTRIAKISRAALCVIVISSFLGSSLSGQNDDQETAAPKIEPPAKEVAKPEKTLPTVKILNIERDGKTSSMSTRMASFYLGKNLAYIAALKSRKVPAEKFQSAIDATDQLAAALKIELPEMPEIKDMGDIWPAREYLRRTDEGSIRRQLHQQHLPECARLYDLAHALFLAPTFYSNDFSDEASAKQQKEINEIVQRDIVSAAFQANFQQESDVVSAFRPFYLWMKEEKPEGPEMGKLMMASLDNFEQLLGRELAEAESGAGQKQPPETKDDSLVGDDKTPEDIEALKILAAFLTAQSKQDAQVLTAKLKPTTEACAELLDESTSKKAIAVYDRLFADPEMVISHSPDQTEIRLRKITTDELISGSPKAREFPGGYRSIAKHLSSGFTIYEFSFVEPGKTRGMRFDGLIRVDGKWYLFPKVWRVLDERPFGYDIK